MSITTKDKAIALLRRAQKILCLSQSTPRADGMAAVLALQHFGAQTGKEVVAVLPQGVSKNLQFLPGVDSVAADLGEPGDFVISLSTEASDVERVKYTIEESSVDILITPKSGTFSADDVSFRHNAAHFDLIIVLDSPSLEALGNVFTDHTAMFASCPTLNISANPGTTDFARTNLVDSTKSSACEIVYDCLQSDDEFHDQIDAQLATILLTGMVASTGSFLQANTTASSLEAAAQLQELGAQQSDIIEHLFKQKSFNTLKVWGRIFATLEVDPTHGLAWATLNQSDLKQVDATLDDLDTLTDEILRYTENVDLAALLIETDTGTTAQVRSQRGSLDWSHLASDFEPIPTENGVDIHFKDETPANAGQMLLNHLLAWQKQRLHIDEATPLQKLEATAPSTPEPTLPIETVKKGVPVKATPPAEVPFVAPKQAHESTGLMPEEHTTPPGTQAAEVMVDLDQKGIPDWLKKSFPKN